MPGMMKGTQGVCQHAVDSGLAAASGSHKHDAVADKHGLIELDNLAYDAGKGLEGVLAQGRVNGGLQDTVIMLWNGDAREEV